MSFDTATSLIVSRLKIDEELSAKVIDATQSALRVMKYKHPTGSIITKGDNDLKRASALLEYIARELAGVKIPMDQLARAAYMRPTEFVKFHQMVGNFRETSESQNAQASRNSTASKKRTSSMPALAIKFGAFVHDSTGIALRAQKLYNKVYRYGQKNPHHRQDMHRFQKVYEAVCYYTAATASQKDMGKVATSTTKTKDDDEGHKLTIATIVDLSNDFSLKDFKDILSHVEEIIQDMDAKNQSGQVEKSSRSKDSLNTSKRLRDAAATTASRESKRPKSNAMLSAQELAKKATEALLRKVETSEVPIDETLEDDPFESIESTLKANPTEALTYQAEFLKWKDAILQKAVEKAKTLDEPMTETDDSGTLRDDDKARALQVAAMAVLARHGLVAT